MKKGKKLRKDITPEQAEELKSLIERNIELDKKVEDMMHKLLEQNKKMNLTLEEFFE